MLIYNCQKEMKTLERTKKIGGNKNENNEKSRNG